MFEDKFRKQFASMFPLEQQEGEEQSANPSLNKNSNQDQSDQGEGRVTPHYKGIEEDQDKTTQRLDNRNENYDGCQDHLKRTNSEGENNYQRMRQNQDINYEPFFNRKTTYEIKDNSQIDQTTQIIVATRSQIKQQKYDFSPVNSSFVHLMDSNFKRNESVEERRTQPLINAPIYIEDNELLANSQSYPEVLINGEQIRKEMLQDPQIRWILVFELLDLQNCQQLTHNSEIEQVLDKIQVKYKEQTHAFHTVSKTLEQRLNHQKSQIHASLEQQADQREKKQFIALYRYEQNKNSVFHKFSQKTEKSIEALQESIDKRFQKVRLQMMRAKRNLTHFIDSQIKEQSEEEEQIQIKMNQLKMSHNQSLQNVKCQINAKFNKVEEEITQNKKRINANKNMIEESLDKLTKKLLGELQLEISQAKQNEQALMNLLLTLIEKLE